MIVKSKKIIRNNKCWNVHIKKTKFCQRTEQISLLKKTKEKNSFS